jgi:hypothetical protein
MYIPAECTERIVNLCSTEVLYWCHFGFNMFYHLCVVGAGRNVTSAAGPVDVWGSNEFY